ncbi:MAG: hypothetical protein D6732_03860 [Methanobacteriota archaeon]|nr:MAG: hypothetical protein D6732_03860 [Euryarchaeota archaeon]
MEFIWTALIAIFLFAMTSVMAKYLIIMFGGPYRFLAYQLTAGLIIVWSILLMIDPTPLNPNLRNVDVVRSLILSSVFAFGGFVCLMIGFSKGNASVGGIFISSRLAINIPLAFVFLGERYPPYVYVLILLTLVGAILVSWDEDLNAKQVFLLKGKGVVWFFLTTALWGLSNLFITDIGDRLSAIEFLSYRQLFLFIATWLFFPLISSKVDLPSRGISFSAIKLLILYILITISAQLLFVFSLLQNLTITEGIGAMEGAATFVISMSATKIFGNSILKEQMMPKILAIRIIGVVLSASGVLAIVLVL